MKSKQKFRTENYFIRDRGVKHGMREVRMVMKVQLAWSEGEGGRRRMPDMEKPVSVIIEIREEEKFEAKRYKSLYKVEHMLHVFGF